MITDPESTRTPAPRPARVRASCTGRSSRSSTVTRTRRAATLAAAPLLLAEADLQASIAYFNTAEVLVLPDGGILATWSWAVPAEEGSFTTNFAFSDSLAGSVGSIYNVGASFVGGTTNYFNAFSQAYGVNVDAGANFATYGVFRLSGNVSFIETTAYFGFRIESPQNAGDYYYGWTEWTHSHDGSNDILTIHRWAVETQANTGIQVGAVPEPADFALGLGALAAGAATVLRKRRKEAA